MMIAGDGKNDEETDPAPLPRPRAREWLWRPWYAKAWWTGMMLYWAGKLTSFSQPSPEAFYTSALAGFLNLLFFPPAILMILGVGYARTRLASGDWQLVATTNSRLARGRSAGGLSDPYSDPLDPRSGMLHWRHFDPRR